MHDEIPVGVDPGAASCHPPFAGLHRITRTEGSSYAQSHWINQWETPASALERRSTAFPITKESRRNELRSTPGNHPIVGVLVNLASATRMAMA
jgi:hypothetical protein